MQLVYLNTLFFRFPRITYNITQLRPGRIYNNRNENPKPGFTVIFPKHKAAIP